MDFEAKAAVGLAFLFLEAFISESAFYFSYAVYYYFLSIVNLYFLLRLQLRTLFALGSFYYVLLFWCSFLKGESLRRVTYLFFL